MENANLKRRQLARLLVVARAKALCMADSNAAVFGANVGWRHRHIVPKPPTLASLPGSPHPSLL